MKKMPNLRKSERTGEIQSTWHARLWCHFNCSGTYHVISRFFFLGWSERFRILLVWSEKLKKKNKKVSINTNSHCQKNKIYLNNAKWSCIAFGRLLPCTCYALMPNANCNAVKLPHCSVAAWVTEVLCHSFFFFFFGARQNALKTKNYLGWVLPFWKPIIPIFFSVSFCSVHSWFQFFEEQNWTLDDLSKANMSHTTWHVDLQHGGSDKWKPRNAKLPF